MHKEQSELARVLIIAMVCLITQGYEVHARRSAVDSANAERQTEPHDTVSVEIPMGDSTRIIVTPGKSMFYQYSLAIAVGKDQRFDMTERKFFESSVLFKDNVRSFAVSSGESWLTFVELRPDRIDTIGYQVERRDSGVAIDVLPIDSSTYLLVHLMSTVYYVRGWQCLRVMVDTIRIIEEDGKRRIVKYADSEVAREGIRYKSQLLHANWTSRHAIVLRDTIRNVHVWNADVLCDARRAVVNEKDSNRKRITLLRSWRCDDEVNSRYEYNDCGIVDGPDYTATPKLTWYGRYALSDSTVGVVRTRWHDTGSMEYDFSVIDRGCNLRTRISYHGPYHDEWLCNHMSFLIAIMVR